MKLFNFFNRRASAPVARERLQILLAHERASVSNSNLVALLHREVLAAVSKHIEIDPDKVEVKLREGDNMSLLEIDIEISASASARETIADAAA
ncbi:cell division topological specificity factor MinE [Methylosinus sp. sav-2]|uniref:cell division topological specificity factor MinE n=1 Tax=Methylosinus sp. sav-2 TaxID=2485168 RepID=UPI000478F95D|nr:cell division topological specificity factor MinE [Methylosinus sp. sav-2]TDX62816.1 cell division topological specificity factor MinE [Methylosinus sp. sav-2]